MEPSFWGIMMYVIPVFGLVFFLSRGTSTHDDKTVGHNTYRNYRKTRMDKPIV